MQFLGKITYQNSVINLYPGKKVFISYYAATIKPAERECTCVEKEKSNY